MAPKRAVAADGPKMNASGKFEGEFKVQQNAPYISHRLEVWDRLFKKHQETVATKPRKAIKITLPDGNVKEGKAFEITPLEIAQGISKGLADSVVVAKLVYTEPVESLSQVVNADAESDDEESQDQSAVLWDLTRPIEGSCRMELLKFDSPQGQDVFWHSSSHMLGQALEQNFGCHLTIGPALDSGFYYDGYFGSKKIGDDDYKVLEKKIEEISKAAQPFERCVITKAEALELFAMNPFKVQLITNKVPDGALTSCYRCGPLIDLCRGPHLPNTSRAKSFMITKNSAAYWLGDQNLDSLQRVYSISFPTDKLMKEHKKFLEEAKKRDHRNVGTQQELFFFHPTASPGSCFWYPMGARIYNKLTELMRSEYRLRGFHEVITPNIYSDQLFMTSGHYQNYKDDMYNMDIEGQQWFLKPMNCPGHFLMFDSRARSYKELPLRFADFGVLHRNEASGALTGLTRVRRFQQDDAHIFVRPDQIKDEVLRCIDFLNYIYALFGFKASFALSTRPKKALGSKEIWDNSEAQLKDALNSSGMEWTLNPGDGAFYGPKIDIRLTDAMKRKFQCGTIQLDFNNPIRFNLQYRAEGNEEEEGENNEKEEKGEFKGAVEKNEKGDIIWREGKLKGGYERPVVMHRAILGSVERFSGIVTEHYGGKWPFWLSPRQVMVVPVGEKFQEYGRWVERQLMLHGIYAECECSGKTLNKKVREATVAQWNFIVVVGDKEASELSVNVRQRDVEKPIGAMSVLEFVGMLKAQSMPTSEPLNEFQPYQGRAVENTAAVPASTTAAPGSAVAKGGATKGANSNSAGGVESFLEHHPYLEGFSPSAADVNLFQKLSSSGTPEEPNMRRWFAHIESFSPAERASW